MTSTADSGIGTLRWALQTARSRDVITFDPAVFPPDAPATIFPRAELPSVSCGSLTIDASSAGVIIDGSDVPGDWNNGLQVYSSDNTVMGLQIVSYAGSGIAVTQGGRHNTIGGDRSLGSGPVGQGNLLSGNGIGINLCDPGTSENTVLGNLVGVAADGVSPWGNRDFGIFIEDDVHDNVIGPGNVIAYNKHGIAITGAGAVRNRITQNDIHSNTQDVALWSGGNANLEAPVIADFNAEVGSVSGFTCAGCLVELFSDTESERSIYEGDARADESGRFAFSGETLLEGESLRATATDSQGNTGPFSIPTRGSGAGRIVQTGNVARKQLLVTYPSSELEDNRIGKGWWALWQNSIEDMPLLLADIVGLGCKRSRMAIGNIDSELLFWDQPELEIIEPHDRLFTELAENGVEITYCLSFWDKENVNQGYELPTPRFKTDVEIERYLDFVEFIVSHFRDRVDHYEIWNEPSLVNYAYESIDVEDYIALTRKAIPVIRGIDPSAAIVVGSTHYLMTDPAQPYLEEVLRSGLMPLVDVVAWHPMYGTSPEYDFHRDYYYEYPSIVRSLKALALANGFEGEFVAQEMCWLSPSQLATLPFPIADWPQVYSEMVCAKYYGRCVEMHLGMDVAVGGLGHFDNRRPIASPLVRRLSTIMSGHEAIDMPVEIDIETDGPVAYCAFRYPNGDRMLAVWTDGIAQDEDPGVPATITFPGLAAGSVTGIDVLHGFQQELVFETVGDDTTVRDLLVKDYPILLRLSDITFGSDYEETVGDGFHRLGEPGAN